MQNGYVESFNGRMRDELLNERLFFGLADARKAISAWVADYNNSRPHSSLAYKTPVAFAAYLIATGHRAALLDGSALRPIGGPFIIENMPCCSIPGTADGWSSGSLDGFAGFPSVPAVATTSW